MGKARTSASVLLVAGFLAALAAGCGSSSTHTKTSASPPATTTSNNPTAAEAVSKCKSVVDSHAATLPSGLKSKLDGICEKAGTNASNLKQALGQVCTEIVNSTVPSAAPKSLKDQALTECKKAFG